VTMIAGYIQRTGLCLALACSTNLAIGASVAKPRPLPTTSFFESFDGLNSRRWMVSDGWVNGTHQGCTWSRETTTLSGGILHLRVTKSPNRLRPYKCAELQTTARYGYGTYEARVRIASGSGLNTAMFTYSGPPLTPKHDEIDFEFLGKNTSTVQLNYFTGARGGHETFAATPSNATAAFHTYAFTWGPGTIKWYIDGKLVRAASGADLPTTPGKFYLTLWSGSPTVNDWLGALDANRLPESADIDWAAFTAAGERCRFPQSTTCVVN
jgi:endo-1,3-1,4-beta-glycanase ExoK